MGYWELLSPFVEDFLQVAQEDCGTPSCCVLILSCSLMEAYRLFFVENGWALFYIYMSFVFETKSRAFNIFLLFQLG